MSAIIAVSSATEELRPLMAHEIDRVAGGAVRRPEPRGLQELKVILSDVKKLLSEAGKPEPLR